MAIGHHQILCCIGVTKAGRSAQLDQMIKVERGQRKPLPGGQPSGHGGKQRVTAGAVDCDQLRSDAKLHGDGSNAAACAVSAARDVFA